MLKITQQRDSMSDSVSLMLEGKLAGPWVEELKTCWRQVAASPQKRRAVVDLTGVTFVDAAGKALLTRMCQEGARLHAIGCLNKCIVEEITKAGRASVSGGTRKGKMKGS